MEITLKEVTFDEKEILRNLLEKYNYEFSQWDERDVNGMGLYGYHYLDYYWTADNRYAAFIMVDGKLAGFVMVNNCQEVDEPMDYSMSEFFVMYKYRRKGVGKAAVNRVLDLFHGSWQLMLHPHNIASVHFWENVISEYTKGEYRLVKAYPGSEYEDGTAADIYFFNT